MNGNVRSEISEVTVNRDDHWTRYSARIGEGGAPIELSGINGNVRLTRAAGGTQTTAAANSKAGRESETGRVKAGGQSEIGAGQSGSESRQVNSVNWDS